MPLSYNVSPGGLHYSPERDYAHNYPRMVACVIRAFNHEFWPDLLNVLAGDFAPSTDRLWEDVCKAKDCFCQFLNICCEDPKETVEDVLKRSGFTALPQAAQIAWMAMLGQVVTGQLFSGIRDTTPMGEKNPTVLRLLQTGRDAARLMNGVPPGADTEELKRGFTLYAEALREAGVEQQEVRKLLTDTFIKEANVAH